jgi:WXXGXW repeat (2 copies)
MYTRISRSIVVTSLAALFALPAIAQVHADLGPLHIRIAKDRPPRAKYERRVARPDRDSVWIAGYWDRQGDQWAWVSGRWDRPAERTQRWIAPRYQQDSGAWRYEPGHWSNQEVTDGDDYRSWKEEHHRSNGDRRPN